MVNHRGEHIPDGSPKGQHPEQVLGWQRRSVKAKASALLAALTQRLYGREGERFFSFLRCKPPPPCSAPAAPGSASPIR